MTWHEGEQIGPYQIMSQLGQGGMATVYKAYHARLDRHVAIKVMHQTFMADETFITRFQREAQIVARLEHPHIVPVYDFNEHKGQPYLVMKYVPGVTLKQRILKSPLPLNDVLYVLNAVGSALAYAHNRGVLHRDVKPSNIVIDKDNIPYLADFGLARIAAAGESTLSADVLLGTPNYISPEQASGVKNLDGRTDIYSLGIVLYELLVGRVPFTADTPYAVIHNHIYTPIPEPSKINPEIPLSVEAVLLKATAKKPQERYATADEMLTALRDAVAEARLTALSDDRDSVADLSLSQYRDSMAASRIIAEPAAATPTPIAGISAPAKGYRTATVYQPAGSGRMWMIGGCGSFLGISFLGLMVLLGAWNNLLEFGEIMQSLAPAQPSGMVIALGRGSPFADLPIYPIPYIFEPAMADEALRMTPRDSFAHLTAAHTYWRSDPARSYATIAQGRQYAEEAVMYLLTAAALADENNDAAAAITYTLLALHEAEKAPDEYNRIRPAAGAYLYRAAEQIAGGTGEISLNIVGEMYSPEELRQVQDSGPRVFVTARVLLLRGNARLANAALSRGAATSDFAAEIDLVQGEIEAATRRRAQAIALWQALVDDETAPEWIQERAEELLEEHTAS